MKLPYSEGSVFLVPLRSSGYGRGIVARAAPRGRVLFGYFFGPRLESPEAAGIEDIDPRKAVLRIRFGDLGLINGEWKLLGDVPNWNPTEWPMPEFGSLDPLTGKAWVARYCDTDPVREESRHQVDPSYVSDLPMDGLFGYGAAEIKLTHVLDGGDREPKVSKRSQS